MNHVRALALVSTIVVGAAGAALATTPSLVGTYSGTYLLDGTTSPQSLQIEVETQHGRRLRVSLFAMNQPEYQGHGHISRDNATVRMGLHATGHRHLAIAATLLDGGNVLDGTFAGRRPGQPPAGGTLTVNR